MCTVAAANVRRCDLVRLAPAGQAWTCVGVPKTSRQTPHALTLRSPHSEIFKLWCSRGWSVLKAGINRRPCCSNGCFPCFCGSLVAVNKQSIHLAKVRRIAVAPDSDLLSTACSRRVGRFHDTDAQDAWQVTGAKPPPPPHLARRAREC